MKTSKLIKDLTKLMEKYGDVDATIDMDSDLCSIGECYYNSFHKIIVIAD